MQNSPAPDSAARPATKTARASTGQASVIGLRDYYSHRNDPQPKVDAPCVHIVDDDVAVRDSISMLLDTLELSHASYDTANAFLDSTSIRPGDVAVMDIRMPGLSGLEAQAELAQRGNKIPIVFITGHGDVPMAVTAMKRGASNFLRKPFRDQELLDSILTGLKSAEIIMESESGLASIRKRVDTLTPREREVFKRVTDGQANKVIAIELHISERTVEVHRSQVMRKMQARSIAELIKARYQLDQASPAVAQ